MPSQRLLKILDPFGHIPTRRVLASTSPVALVWATHASRAWMARALADSGFVPLLASALRHVRTSTHPGARPAVSLVVAELMGADEDAIATLTAARWAGYAGDIWLVSSTPPAPRLVALLDARVVAANENSVRATRRSQPTT